MHHAVTPFLIVLSIVILDQYSLQTRYSQRPAHAQMRYIRQALTCHCHQQCHALLYTHETYHDVLISMHDEAAFQDLAHIKLYDLIGTTLTQQVQLDSSNMLIEYSPPLQRTRRSIFVAAEPLSSRSGLESQ